MSYVFIQPYIGCDIDVINEIAERLMQKINIEVKLLPFLGKPDYAYDPIRGQYHSTKILSYIIGNNNNSAIRTIGVIDVDLFIPILTYVFGEAQLNGRVAIISGARLKQEYYGLKPNKRLYIERLFKEVIHELGHTLGLTHCEITSCVMHLSNTVIDIDKKTSDFCLSHKEQFMKKLKELEMQYGE